MRWLWLSGLLAVLVAIVALLVRLQRDIEPRDVAPDGPPPDPGQYPRPPGHD